MALPLKEWLKTKEIQDFNKSSEELAYHYTFFRNPPRVAWSNRDLISSPADGVITSQGVFKPDEPLDVKGNEVTVTDILCGREIGNPSLVTAIFMTAADVHCNRAPTDVVIERHPMPAIQTQNVPMIWAEHGMLDAGLIRPNTFGFMQANKRVVNRCYCGALDYTYWLVQIADSDVNCIIPMRDERVSYWNQNEIFSKIEWGSMCVLILPVDKRYDFRPACKLLDHVEAGVDPLVRIERRT